MKTFKLCRLALTLAAILLGFCPAHATITVLNYWHMGETDPQAASGGYCTNTVDAVGGDTLTNNSVGGYYPTYTNSVSPVAAVGTGSSLALVLTNGQYATGLLATNLADNFGIECWVNPATTATAGAVLAHNGLRDNGWGLYQNGTNYEVLYGAYAFWGNGLATTGVWTHLALVRNQGVATLYVNGAPTGTFSGTPITPSGSFTVGGNAEYGEYFSGAIDEVRVFTFAPGAFSTNDLLLNHLLVSNTQDSGAGSLRAATANGSNNANIYFAPGLSGQTILLTSGPIVLSNNMTIDASALPGGIQINGNGAFTVFSVSSGVTNALNALTITNGYISSYSAGGGIENNGTLTLNQCIVTGNNNALEGGGIANNAVLTLNQCTVAGNGALEAGGIANNAGGTLTLNECALVGNNAASGDYRGGGILNGGTMVLNQCSFEGNSGYGGGILNGGLGTIIGCTLSGNSGSSGGGIFNNSSGRLAVTNTIVAGNSAGSGSDIYVDSGGSLAYGGSNLVQSVANGGTITGPSPLTNAPNLAPLGNYGGPTQTMPPLPGSPAIGVGSVSANTFTNDQRGYARTQNGQIDIGAVELPTIPPFTASPTNDWQYNPVQFNGPGVDSDGSAIVQWHWSFGDGTTGTSTLQNTNHVYGTGGIFSPSLIVTNSLGLSLAASGPAIYVNFLVTNTADSGPGTLRLAISNDLRGQTIAFATNLSGATITLASTLTINTNLTIDASALPGGIHINGNGTVRVFNVAATNITAILDSLTITNGYASSEGGGIFNNGKLTLNECALLGNIANSGFGGGIFNNSGTLTLNQCTLEGNSSSYGAGIYNISGTATIIGCTLSGNNAVDSSGGGGFYSLDGSVAMTNTIVAGNSGPNSADIAVSGNGSTLTYGGSNLVQSVISGSGTITITGPLPLNAAPHLALPGNYGGPTPTMPPQPGSPAIGAGSVAANTFTNDQRGYARTQNGLIDIGAVERPTIQPFTASPTNDWQYNPVQFNGPGVDSDGTVIAQWNWSFGDGTTSTSQNPSHIYNTPGIYSPGLIMTNSLGLTFVASGPAIYVNVSVTNNADSGPGSLRAAIANASNGQVIMFATNLSGTNITLASTLTINTNLTIDASTLPGGIQINGHGVVTVFLVPSGFIDVLNALTITNGFDSSSFGGGINNDGTLTLNQCTLAGNNANGPGGGIFNSATLTLNECTLTKNSTIHQGGGGIFNQGTVILNGCTVTGNTEPTGSEVGFGGGGIDNDGTLAVTNCIIAGNSAATGGADIYNYYASLTYGGSNLVESVTSAGSTVVAGPAPLDAAPNLAPLGNYGGTTQIMPPLPGSPAIGAGSLAANTFATDQRGYARTQNGRIDIGAVELPTVQPFTDSPTNDWQLNPVQFNSPGVDSDGTAIVEWNWSFGDGTTGAGQNTNHAYATTGVFSPGLVVTNSLGLALAVSGPAITVSLPPNVTGVTLSGTSLTIHGTGISGITYHVLASTNLALPLSQWTPLSTNTWRTNGVFSLTLTKTLNRSTPGLFYLLEEP